MRDQYSGPERRALMMGWHLDKRVPISIIATLFAQLAVGIWFVSKLESRVESLERGAVAQQVRDDKQDLALLDGTAAMNARLDRIDGKLDRLIERSLKP